MKIVQIILNIVGIIFMLLYLYQILFIAVGTFARRKKYPEAKKYHTFAILICGRNEEKVIGNLIDSIQNNNYPQEKIRIFVCADNCDPTDRTAAIAREKRCIVYERHDQSAIGKGYALRLMFDNIANDFPAYEPDAIMVFDADNLLAPNYIAEMNKALDSGVQVCTSFRNSKNYGTNWVSAGASLSFVRECQFFHKSKAVLGLSTHVSGTGFYFSKEVMSFKTGWPYTMITEDLEFSASSTLNGVKIGYCEDAEFFDEQPTKFKQAYKQRLRWCKGGLMGFSLFHRSLLGTFFKTQDFTYYEYYFSRFFPVGAYYSFSFVASCIVNTLARVLEALNGQVIANAVYFMAPLLIALFTTYIGLFVDSVFACLVNWKRIRATTKQKIMSMFALPLFTMLISMPASVAALFKKVKWEPIEHNESITQRQLEEMSSNG